MLAQNEQQDELAVRNEICADRMDGLQDCSNYAYRDSAGRVIKMEDCSNRAKEKRTDDVNAAKLKERT